MIDGEERGCGNKRKDEDGSVIPIDDELKTVLIEYLLTRSPPLNHQQKQTRIPLFTKPDTGSSLERLKYHSIRSQFGTTTRIGALAEFDW